MPERPKKAKKAKAKRMESFDLLEITESLGYQIHRKSGRNSWSKEEDDELRALMSGALIELGYTDGLNGVKTIQQSLDVTKSIPWDSLAQRFRNTLRNGKDLRKRWSGSLDPNLKKGRWTKDEDDRLIRAYEKHGSHWLSVSLEISGRTEDQCAKRYIEVLGPGSKGRLREWTLEEDLLLISKVKAYGTKWRKISSEMEFRPSLTCRNRWRKIITTVVRNQAAPEIAAAVKENKDLDLSNGTVSNIKKENNESISRVGSAPPQNIQNTEHSLPLRATNSASDTSFSHPTTINRPVSNPAGNDLLPNKHLPPLSELSPSPGVLENSATPLGAFSVRNGFNNHIQPTDSLSPLVRATGLLSNSPRPLDHFMNPDLSSVDHLMRSQSTSNIPTTTTPATTTQQIEPSQQPVSKTPIAPLHTQTEWKFTLKDRKGLSISNGSINNSDLVRELIGQARKYSLKISVHQHIHNHYGGGSMRGATNGNFNNASTSSSSNSKGLSPDAISELYNNPYMVKSSASLPTDIIQQLNENTTQNFNIHQDGSRPDIPEAGGNDILLRNQPAHYPSLEFALSPANPENRNPNDRLFYNEHTKTAANPALLTAGSVASASSTASPHFASQTIQNRISPASMRTDGSGNSTSNNTPGSNGTMKSQSSDLPDVGPSRFSHFNYLPATIRPQLGSSDNRGTSDLNKILNPSPLSSGSRRKRSFGSKHKHLKMRKKSRSHATGSDESAVIPEERKTSGSRKSSKSRAYSSSEDGVDFWEKLRSLDRHGINAESTSNSSTNENTPANDNGRHDADNVPTSEEEDVNDPFYYLKPSS